MENMQEEEDMQNIMYDAEQEEAALKIQLRYKSLESRRKEREEGSFFNFIIFSNRKLEDVTREKTKKDRKRKGAKKKVKIIRVEKKIRRID